MATFLVDTLAAAQPELRLPDKSLENHILDEIE